MKVNEGIQVEDIESCPLCGVTGILLYKEMCDRLTSAPGLWSVLNCPACGILWLNPRPIVEDIGKIYSSTYCTHTLNEQKKIFTSLREKIEEYILKRSRNNNTFKEGRDHKSIKRTFGLSFFFKDIADAEVMWLNGQEKGKLLDVGCGSGRFLARMRDLGWDVTGIEPDQTAATLAREHLKLPIINRRFEDIDIPANSFNAITLRHVIEHVHDPVKFLQKCYQLLAPGGTLVALTPNAESLGHKIFGRSWYELDPPRHLYLFSQKSLTKVAKIAGVSSLIQIRSTARKARWTWAPSIAIRSTGYSNSKTGLIGSARFFFWAIEEMLNIIPESHWGEELIMIARKE